MQMSAATMMCAVRALVSSTENQSCNCSNFQTFLHCLQKEKGFKVGILIVSLPYGTIFEMCVGRCGN